MSRSIGEVEPVQDLLPDWFALVLSVLTQLGDPWFLIVLLAGLYWTQFDRQDDIMLVGGMLVAGIGIYRTLKYVFGLPRPDQPLLDPELVPWIIRPLYELTAFSSSYGFPSGHATMSTIVYFGLALVLPVGPRRVRFLAAGATVAVVGFTRVGMGLHFLVDIVAGVALGAAVLYVGYSGVKILSRDRVTILLFVALLCNTTYLFASDGDIEAVITFGAALGLFGGWQLVEFARELVAVDRPSRATLPILVRGGLCLLTLGPLVLALEAFPLLTGDPGVAGTTGLFVAMLVVIPIARYSTRVRRFGGGILFWLDAAVTTVRRTLSRIRG